MKGYFTLGITFKEQDHAKETKVNYLVIDAPYSYNMIIGRPSFNRMGAALSTLYLCMKYLLLNGRVGVLRGDREISRKCFVEILKLRIGHPPNLRGKSQLGIVPLKEAGKDKEASYPSLPYDEV